MNAFIKFNRGILKMPSPWKAWLMLLVAANMVVPLFYIKRPEAQIIVITLLASMTLMTLVTGMTGFTRLLGLGHFFWFPLIAYLWFRLDAVPADGFYGVWIRGLIAINSISLVIDVIDVLRYIRGDRAETVGGLNR